MRATAFEYKYRFLIHAVIFLLAFQAPWNNALNLTDETTWQILANVLMHRHLLGYLAASNLIVVLSLLFMGLAAWLRIWGSAYVGAGIVHSDSMHGDAMLADGPYRRTRNPLYLGTLLHTIGLAIIMTPSGAIFCIALIWILQIRLALAEEPFLTARFGQPYLNYKTAVPRFIPALLARVPAAGRQPHWLQAIVSELYFLGAFLVVAVFGWDFDTQILRRGILVSLGAWLIVLAFMPRKKPDPIAPQTAG